MFEESSRYCLWLWLEARSVSLADTELFVQTQILRLKVVLHGLSQDPLSKGRTFNDIAGSNHGDDVS